jgi:hypothetical protein
VDLLPVFRNAHVRGVFWRQRAGQFGPGTAANRGLSALLAAAALGRPVLVCTPFLKSLSQWRNSKKLNRKDGKGAKVFFERFLALRHSFPYLLRVLRDFAVREAETGQNEVDRADFKKRVSRFGRRLDF